MVDTKKEQEREELHRAIWAIADDLRGAVDGWDFKSYVLGTMFYRYISENIASYINQGEIDAGKTRPSGCALPPFTAMEPTKRKRMAFWTRKTRKIPPTLTRAAGIFWTQPFRTTMRCSTRTTRPMANGSRITIKMYRSA